jgi:peptide/nickel transport system ATP-binding protein
MMDLVAPRPLVEIRDLNVRFVSREATVAAVNGVSFDLMAGEVLCIIGESGSGKSVTMRSILRLHPPRRTVISGSIRVGEHDILSMDERAMNEVRGPVVSMIFQEPMTALDPVYRIGDQITETVIRHEGGSRKAAAARALELLQLVKVPSPERRLRAFPHELSGGLRQRAMIAVALSCRPSLLLADEPTTALDATVQIQVLVMLRGLQREFGMGMIFVTHDLGVAAQIADKVAVMYAGRIVEYGSVADVLMRPAHPYTLGLLSSTVHGQSRDTPIEAIPGSPPDLRNLPRGCSFAPRCKFQIAACTDAFPPRVEAGVNHTASCLRVDDVRGASLAHRAA